MELSAVDWETFERIGREFDDLRFKGGLLSLALALRAFNADQPRVAAGSPDGGQWTSGGADVATVEPVQEILFGRLPPVIEQLLRFGRIRPRNLIFQRNGSPG